MKKVLFCLNLNYFIGDFGDLHCFPIPQGLQRLRSFVALWGYDLCILFPPLLWQSRDVLMASLSSCTVSLLAWYNALKSPFHFQVRYICIIYDHKLIDAIMKILKKILQWEILGEPQLKLNKPDTNQMLWPKHWWKTVVANWILISTSTPAYMK